MVVSSAVNTVASPADAGNIRKYQLYLKTHEMSPTDSGSLELAVLAAATVIAGRGNLLLFEFRLAGNTQPNTRDRFTASLGNSFVAFLAMG